jgi:hypothetical protein
MKFSMTQITKPALLAMISYVILSFVILLPLNNTYTNDAGQAVQDTFWTRVLLVIILLIPIALSIYSINCMVVGGCHIWAWVQGIIVAFWVLLFIIASIVVSEEPKKN